LPKNARKVVGVVATPQAAASAPTGGEQLPPLGVLLRGLDLMTSRALLGRLAVGDLKALAELGLNPEHEQDFQRHEWGLARNSEGYWLVSGAAGEIDWSGLGGLSPLAHTHPTPRRRHRLLVLLDLAGVRRHQAHPRGGQGRHHERAPAPLISYQDGGVPLYQGDSVYLTEGEP
jgi:hypothetical protein